MRAELLILAALALSAPAAAQTTGSGSMAWREAENLGHGLACGWLRPFEVAAMRLNIDSLAVSSLVNRGEADKADVVDSAATSQSYGEKKPCATGKYEVQVAARQAAEVWVINSVALLDAQGKADWSAQFTSAERYAPALRKGLEIAMGGFGGAAVKKNAADIQAASALRRLCPERKQVRACPPAKAEDDKYLPVSRVFVEGVETFAPLYAPPVF